MTSTRRARGPSNVPNLPAYQARKIRFRLREPISYFWCVPSSQAALKAESLSSSRSRTGNELSQPTLEFKSWCSLNHYLLVREIFLDVVCGLTLTKTILSPFSPRAREACCCCWRRWSLSLTTAATATGRLPGNGRCGFLLSSSNCSTHQGLPYTMSVLEGRVLKKHMK